MKSFEEALRLGRYRQVLDLCSSAEEPASFDMRVAHVRALVGVGEPMEALELAWPLLDAQQKPSLEWARATLELSEVLQDLGDSKRALELALEAHEVLPVRALVQQANCLFDMDRYEEACDLGAQAERAALDTQDTEQLALALNVQALSLAERGPLFLSDALAVREREVKLTLEAVGREHPDFATSLEAQGDILEKAGALARALQCAAEAALIRKSVLGAEDESAAEAEEEVRELALRLLQQTSDETVGAAGARLVCEQCGQVREYGAEHRRCGRCRGAWWCGPLCQKLDDQHPRVCEQARQAMRQQKERLDEKNTKKKKR